MISSWESGQRRAMYFESAIGLSVNGVLVPLLFFLIGTAPPATPQDLLRPMVLASGISTLAMGFFISRGIEKKISQGKINSLPGFSKYLVFLKYPFIRALFFSLISILTFPLIWSEALKAAGILPKSSVELLFFNSLFGASIGLTVVPLIVWLALSLGRTGPEGGAV